MESNESGYKATGETKDSSCAFDNVCGLALAEAELPEPVFDCPPAQAPNKSIVATLTAIQIGFFDLAITILGSINFSDTQKNELFCHLRHDLASDACC